MTRFVNSSDAAYLLYSVLPLDWMCTLARSYGRLTYLVRRRQRSTVRRNLDRAFGETKTSREIESLTRQFFEYTRIRGLLLSVSPRLEALEIEQLLPIEGLEYLDAALERKQGVILLGSHLNPGCWLLTVARLRERGYDVRSAVADPEGPWPPTVVRRFLNRRFRTRALSGSVGAFYAQFNIRPIVRCLSGNAIVAQAGDGLRSARFVEADFLGHRVPFPTGMASVAQITGAVVVPMFHVGTPPDRLRTVIEEPWTVEREDDGALHNAVTAYAKRLEHHVLENIPCWDYWGIADTFSTMATWREKSLKERYEG
jgi:lauroyl/myristoyl acyltransferase